MTVLTTFDPILAIEAHPRFEWFRPRPGPEPGTALVVHCSGRSLAVLRQPWESVDWFDLMIRAVRKIYRVNVAEHALCLTSYVPCESEAFYFFATVHFSCRVADPIKVVERGIRDVRAVLEPALVEAMRSVGRRHKVEESARAEVAITEALRAQAASAGFSEGLEVKDIAVRLDLDQAARNHVRQLEEARYRHTEELARLDQDRVRLSLQSELDDLKTQFEIQRANQYRPMIEQGQWQLLQLHLARNPDDVAGVVKHIRDQDQAVFERMLKALQFMLENDTLEPSQLGDSGKKLLREVYLTIKGTSQRLDGTVARVKAIEDGGGGSANGA